MINYDVIYASQQRLKDLIAEANTRPMEVTGSRPSIFDRALAALQATFAKPAQQPSAQKGFATH